MKSLKLLLENVHIQSCVGSIDISITNIYDDSNKVVEGSLFVAIIGANIDGHNFIKNALDRGAIAVICQYMPDNIHQGITYVKVDNTSFSLGLIASNFFNNPSFKIKLIGITGTNGKTSTAYYLYLLFRKLNFKVGLISTIENKIHTKSYPSNLTTPNSIYINKLLSLMVSEGCQFCFMEVSSHGICQQRISGLDFDVAVFTNITRDHLDYHKSFENYLNTKKSFFDHLSSNATSIVNIDDQYAKTIMMDTQSKKLLYGIRNRAHHNTVIVENTIDGLTLEFDGVEITTKLAGNFNAYNLLAAYTVALHFNQEKKLIQKHLSSIQQIPGRFNLLRSKGGVIGIIDYAHTPDALQKVIASISSFCNIKNDLIVVIGCGGNRDQGKRSLMGKIAYEESNMSIFTSDNPRYEDPNKIINDMLKDVSDEDKKDIQLIPNREDAICLAVKYASKGSVILLAGKGHEKFQDINGVKTPFNDFKILKKLLKI